MALTPIVKALYPHVPKLPGVPPLLRNAANPVQAIAAFRGVAQGYLMRFLTTETQWSIYTVDGFPLVQADTFVDMNYRFDSSIPRHPVQQGQFASYNKVINPYRATVQLAKGGGLNALSEIRNIADGGGFGRSDDNQRSQFLDDIDAAAKSLDLFHVITPEKTYINANITNYSYQRQQSGTAYKIIVDIELEEVIEKQAQYTTKEAQPATLIQQPKDPNAAATVNTGKTQALPVPDTSVLKDVMDKALDLYNRVSTR